MIVRLARPDEFEEIGEITVAAYADFTDGPDDHYIARLRDSATRAVEAELWVATDQGRLLGSVTSCPVGSPWREIARDHEGEFRMLAVDPATRRTGAGQALVHHVLDHWQSLGATGMAMSSLAEMTSAHALYGRLGFSRAPERDWSPMPGVDLIAFALTFGAASESMS